MLSRLLSNRENCIQITSLLLKRLTVTVTDATLEKDLHSHPDYPSLLSICDVLHYYGVDSLSFRTDIAKLIQLPTPFVVQIRKENDPQGIFTVVLSANKNSIRYFNGNSHRWEDCSITDFEEIWTSGIVMVPDADNAKGEEKYKQKRREERKTQFLTWTTLAVIPLLASGVSIVGFAHYGTRIFSSVLFLFLNVIGTGIVGLLLWYELDKHNPVLRQICSGSKKVDCSAVLQSDASRIAGISWSNIGFVYFGGSLFLLLTVGIENNWSLFVLGWLSLLALPYTVFSVYYQWQETKQWCILCLGVQAVLALQAMIAITSGWPAVAPAASASLSTFLFSFFLCYTMPAIAISLLMPAWRAAKESRYVRAELQRLKRNPHIFDALLSRQKPAAANAEGLGILLGNPKASVKIIKVCNPFCRPCAQAHAPVDELLYNNPDIQVQIIFTATNEEGDSRAPPVKHLLAIAEKGSQSIILQALRDWYSAEQKSYETFAAKYPMNGELERQEKKIDAMLDWCHKTGISHTPTFFVKGNQLPEIYNIHELKYFLSQ